MLIAAGGAIGTVLRGQIGTRAAGATDSIFPRGTLLVNISGAFVAGLLATLLLERFELPVELRTAILVGVLGGHTPYFRVVWAGQSVARFWT
ncbi:MAG: CrcB family protein [Dehalococcoidia bacterium]|jgi:CrcB protein|nr:CrcB family protein [Dehalococcoidia bacterium]